MTQGSARLFAPVANPAPPKPPQLNIVASSLIPDLGTDTFAPGGGPQLASAGLTCRWDEIEGRHVWDRPAGNQEMAETITRRNALVAAIATMSDVEMKQAELDAGVTVDSMPESVYGASADSRWTGGFAYAPENQYQASLVDPCGQALDLPGLPAPTVTATPNTSSGTLPAATYFYKVTATTSNGESLPSAAVSATLAAPGRVILTWTQVGIGAVTGWKVYGRPATTGGTYGLIGTVTSPTFTDTSATALGAAPPSTNTTGGSGNYGNEALVQYVPFIIEVEDECSTWGWSERDFVGRALRLLDNATPNALEREFWNGIFATNTLTGPMQGTNQFLTQSGTAANGGTGVAATDLTPGGGPPSITRGIQILEDYLATTGFGGQGMLHVQPETSPNLLGARRVGGLLLSVMDNIIVPGSGYGVNGPGGAAPAAGTAWIFATDLTSVRLDKPEVTPSTLAEATDRGSGGQPNTIRFRAHRFGAVSIDGARFAACRVTLST